MALADFIPHYLRLSSDSGRVHTVRAADGSWVRVLEIGGVYQSATYLDERWAEPVFNYYRSFDIVFELVPDAKHALMVGGGGYAWPKHVALTHPGVVLDVVEIEAGITEAAKRWFFLDRAMSEHPGAINLIEADGRAYLDGYAACHQTSALLYDAIVIDAFAGVEPVQSLATVEALRSAKACLQPEGVLLANVVSADAGSDVTFLRNLVATAREVFQSVHVLLCEEDSFAIEDNYLLVASGRKIAPSGSIDYDAEFLGDVLHDSKHGKLPR